MNTPITPHGGGAHTAGPRTVDRDDGEDGEIYYAVHGKNYEFVSNFHNKADALLDAAAPDLAAAAGPAITALAFEQESALERGDQIAFQQITAAKAGLIAALAKSKGGYDALNVIDGEVVEPRAAIAKATP